MVPGVLSSRKAQLLAAGAALIDSVVAGINVIDTYARSLVTGVTRNDETHHTRDVVG